MSFPVSNLHVSLLLWSHPQSAKEFTFVTRVQVTTVEFPAPTGGMHGAGWVCACSKLGSSVLVIPYGFYDCNLEGDIEKTEQF